MSNDRSTILSGFNDHFLEFITDISNVFPNDPDILAAKNSLMLIRKANPKIIIGIWYSYIVVKYKDSIESGDIGFFLEKNYVDDLNQAANSAKIVEAIDRLRNPVKMMNPEDQKKTMKYIQNLTKLALLFHTTD
uniref:Uncharacterized protein n=1 Tax=viral metagenome TaxID=1070528 RepID=A0A6C0LEH0_9ZZZZ